MPSFSTHFWIFNIFSFLHNSRYLPISFMERWLRILYVLHGQVVVEFQVFEEPLHHGPIAGLSTCLWKPIFMSFGQYDNSVRIWNYLTTKLLLNQPFIETVMSISMHPTGKQQCYFPLFLFWKIAMGSQYFFFSTGLYALVGFSDKIRYFLVLIDKLQAYREFGIAQCQILSFSNNGHLFAAECEHSIFVYSTITFQKIACFKGHYQEV